MVLLITMAAVCSRLPNGLPHYQVDPAHLAKSPQHSRRVVPERLPTRPHRTILSSWGLDRVNSPQGLSQLLMGRDCSENSPRRVVSRYGASCLQKWGLDYGASWFRGIVFLEREVTLDKLCDLRSSEADGKINLSVELQMRSDCILHKKSLSTLNFSAC